VWVLSFEGDATFGTYILINTAPGPNFAYEDPFAAQYDTSGTFNWVTHGGSGWHDAAYGVAVDPWGNILVAGTINPDGVSRYWNGLAFNGSTSSSNGDDMFMVKMGNISGPPILSISVSQNNISCNGLTDGTANAIASGGALMYSYLWSTGDTTASLTGLSAGTYSVTITDTANTIIIDSVTIVDPLAISDTISVLDVSCFGGDNGVVNLSVSGGTAPYSFLWSNADSTQNISGLTIGQYTVTITDANNCNGTSVAIISQPSSAVTSQVNNQIDVSCFSGSDGSADILVSGGTSPYSYQWSTGSNSQNVSNLIAGQYFVTITDSNNCLITDSVLISQPTSIASQVNNSIDISCFNGDNGSIDIDVFGGTTPYTYLWSNGEATQDISNLPAGQYMVTITDSLNCTFSYSTVISQPASAISGQGYSVAQTSTTGNGKVWVSVSGGTPGYSYQWNDPAQQTTDTAFNLAAASYQVVFTDANGCSDSITVEVNDSISTGVEELPNAMEAFIYPNPSSGEVTISFKAASKIEVINMIGQVIFTENVEGKETTHIDLNQPTGIYLVNIHFEQAIITKKLIIK